MAEPRKFVELMRGSSLWPASQERPVKSALLSLFVASLATLYIEIMLIRWIGTEVRIFAYFQNLALIACFLGFGLGCYWSSQRKNLLSSLVAMTGLVALVQLPLPGWKRFLSMQSNLLTLSPDAVLWGDLADFSRTTTVMLFLASVGAVAGFLILLVAAMIPLGQWVGFYLNSADNVIAAYSVNLLGSVAGLWCLAGLAYFWFPPGYWFALAFLLIAFIRPPTRRFALAGALLLACTMVLLWSPKTEKSQTYWSPYQKLDVVHAGEQQYAIRVNNTGYMSIANTTLDFLARHPEIAQRYRDESSYDTPFRFALRRDRVLIVGAGAGNDAAAALRNGADLVDAVEIDPVIYSLGKRLHPEQPYNSPRVRKIINDARAFFRQTEAKYDIVIFGLLDSHTQFSDYSNMRIDNYVYTEEAFREARRLLKPDGILILKFAVRAPWEWTGQRFYLMLSRIFGRPPVVYWSPTVGGLSPAIVYITSDSQLLWDRATDAELGRVVASHPPLFALSSGNGPSATTDDWPYVYHRDHSIPRTYLTVSFMLLVMSLLLVRGVVEPGRASTWVFFFLGAGFLLIETQMISRLALYFGTTWLVNCVAITVILVMLVLANVYVSRWRPDRLGPYYFLLVVSLLGNYVFPWQRLAYSAPTVGLLMSAAYSFPVLLAGIIFTETLRGSERKASAFGANLLGAVAGGLAQNVSFIVGLKALLLLAAAVYALAALWGFLAARQTAAASPAFVPAAKV